VSRNKSALEHLRENLGLAITPIGLGISEVWAEDKEMSKTWPPKALTQQMEEYLKWKRESYTDAKIYFKKPFLIQVAYFKGSDGKYYSISEAFYKLIEHKIRAQGGNEDRTEYSIEDNFDEEIIKTIFLLNLERKSIPVALSQKVSKASSEWKKQLGNNWSINYDTDIPVACRNEKPNRIWVNFAGKLLPSSLIGADVEKQKQALKVEVRDGWRFDPLHYDGQVGFGYSFYTYKKYAELVDKSSAEALEKSQKKEAVKSSF
jgi:hypothetical protein